MVRLIPLAFALLMQCALWSTAAQAADAPPRWTAQQANSWYDKQPWLVGSNYNPASAINELEMWQADTFDPAGIDRELGWAEKLGMNTMRVYLHNLLWETDAPGFKKRLNEFLEIASRHRIRPIFVLFDSCWDPEPKAGPQHPPIPGVHTSGWVQAPGRAPLEDALQYPKLRGYVEDIVGTFGKDHRVLAWDVWNEPDNEGGGNYPRHKGKQKYVEILLPQAFDWAFAIEEDGMKAPGLLLCLTCACAPSRASLFDPVRSAVTQRTGITPEWRSGTERPPAVEKRVRELLAAPLTADSAALVAVLNSAELQGIYEDLASAGAALVASRTPPNPELAAELRFPLGDARDTQIELSAMQSVTGLLEMIPRSSAADADLRAARREAIARTVELAARAKMQLYEAATDAQRLALRRTVAETATAAAELARKLHEAGNITDLALVREALFEEDAQVTLRGAEAEAAASREELNAVLGLSGEATAWKLAEHALDEPAKNLDNRELERDAVAASLELEALRWRLEAAGGRVGAARLASFLPHLGLGASAVREGGEWHAGPALSLSLPLFDFGSGKRAAAWADVRRLQQRYAAVAVEVRATARAARERLAAAEERLARIHDKLLPLRERLIDESVKQYNAMTLGPFELLQIRREQIDIEERHIEALRDAWIARTAAWQLRAGSRPAPADTRRTP